MPRVIAAKCPWPSCQAEWTTQQTTQVLFDIGYLQDLGGVKTYVGRGVKGSTKCPACGRPVDVVANPNLPLIVTLHRPWFKLVEKDGKQ